MICSGAAWWYEYYAPDRPQFQQCQEDAQKNKRGLWAEEGPVAPWIGGGESELKTMLLKKLMAPLLALTLTPAAYGKTFQDLSYAYEVKPGMKASEVLNIMGDAPAANEYENSPRVL